MALACLKAAVEAQVHELSMLPGRLNLYATEALLTTTMCVLISPELSKLRCMSLHIVVDFCRVPQVYEVVFRI